LTTALDEKVLALDRALAGAGVPHAFGGALALAYYATPRGTIDIDVNVFAPAAQAEHVLGVLAPIGVERGAASAAAIRERGQVRVRWERTPIDLFFAYDPLHDRCLERARTVPFGEEAEIPILSAEDLAVFKVIFDRPKDWHDLAEMLYAQAERFDAAYAFAWLRRILEPDDPRLARFAELVEAGG
jgi:hypothetical protein